jgi:hypothetical protein
MGNEAAAGLSLATSWLRQRSGLAGLQGVEAGTSLEMTCLVPRLVGSTLPMPFGSPRPKWMAGTLQAENDLVGLFAASSCSPSELMDGHIRHPSPFLGEPQQIVGRNQIDANPAVATKLKGTATLWHCSILLVKKLELIGVEAACPGIDQSRAGSKSRSLDCKRSPCDELHSTLGFATGCRQHQESSVSGSRRDSQALGARLRCRSEDVGSGHRIRFVA